MILYLAYALTVLVLASGLHALVRRRPGLANPLCTGLLLLLVGKIVLEYRPDWEYALCSADDYAYIQSMWWYVLGVLFLAAAAGALAQRSSRIAVLALAATLHLLGLHAHTALVMPGRYGDDRLVDAAGHMHQSSGYTCGPSAAAAACAALGVTVSERTMADRCFTTNRGTTLFSILRGLRLSLPGRRIAIARVDAPSLTAAGAITVCTAGNHAVCLIGTGTGAVVHDPLEGEPQRWDRVGIAGLVDGVAVVVSAPSGTPAPAAPPAAAGR